ncbi:mitochondrial import i [Ascodesmis nigricans]|uniref:Mitochondrial import inner membrane translocase subunit TIM23 n=1 Tax=Ascodesmis nigricans TaxID=341454 RepID=A0A4S2N4M8_9PEZI|nr:mitochondrial import i [Ascodesmis nigricans]
MASFWNALTGKKSPPTTSPASTTSTDAPPDSGDTAPTTSFTQTSDGFDYTQVQDASSFMSSISVDPTALHPLAGLDKDLTYLDLEDSALSTLPGSGTLFPSRGWSDDLCYGTGATYLVGLTVGGAWGMAEGLKKHADAPPRIKLNGVLNSVTRRGPFLGNSAGVLALVYNGLNSTIGYYRGKHDTANSVLAGALSGALFKSTRGLKPMVWSSSLVGLAAGAWSVGSKALVS